MNSKAHTLNAGFSLVEIMIVVSVLAILAAIVIPKYSNASDETEHAAAAVTMKTVQKKIQSYYAIEGEWPGEIDPNWFTPASIPNHPYAPGHAELVTHFVEDKTELNWKHNQIREGFGRTSYIFWYNAATGTFHTPVPWQGSDQATLELYNRVNHCDSTTP